MIFKPYKRIIEYGLKLIFIVTLRYFTDRIVNMVNVVLQIFDFFIKASVEYVKTPAGQKEWADIRTAAGMEKVPQEGKAVTK